MVQDYIKEKGEELNDDNLKEEIRNQCVSIAVEQDIRHYITFNSLFSIRVLEEFPKYKTLLKSIVDSDGEEGTKCFMMAMVHFFIEKYPKLEVAIPTFLKFVFDADILSEDTLLKWEDKKFKTNKKSSFYNRKNEKTFKKKAEKLFTWLKEAEADEEEESEEEDEQKELTEDELKAKKMKEMIEKQKQDLDQELAEQKAKKEEEDEKVKSLVPEDLLHVDDEEQEEEVDIDDI
jgi:hypothetical protein